MSDAKARPFLRAVPEAGALESHTIRWTARSWTYLRELADKNGKSVGAVIDEAFGGPRHGGWNDGA